MVTAKFRWDDSKSVGAYCPAAGAVTKAVLAASLPQAEGDSKPSQPARGIGTRLSNGGLLHPGRTDLLRRGADTGKNAELVDSCVHGYGGEGICG